MFLKQESLETDDLERRTKISWKGKIHSLFVRNKIRVLRIVIKKLNIFAHSKNASFLCVPVGWGGGIFYVFV